MLIEKIREKILLISLVYWLYIYTVLVLLLIGLMLGALLSQEWVIGDGWSGDILKVNSGSYKGNYYSSINCCEYERLAKAGIVFVVFEIISIILLLIWLIWIISYIKGADFIPNWAKYTILGTLFICHSTAIIAWGGISQLSFKGNEHSTTGPALAVSISVILPVIIGIYLLAFKKEPENLPNMDSIRVEARYKWSESKIYENVVENRN